jgi:hypothetical protein
MAERFRADYDREVLAPVAAQVASDRVHVEEAMAALPADAACPLVAEDAEAMRIYHRRQLRRLDRLVELMAQERERLVQEIERRAGRAS